MSSSSAPGTPQPSPVKDPWKDAGRITIKPPSQNGFQRVDISTPQFSVQPVPPPPPPPPSFHALPTATAAAVVLTSMKLDEPRSSTGSAFMPVFDGPVNHDDQLSPFTRGHSRNASSDFDKQPDLTSRSLNSVSPTMSLRSSGLLSDSQASTPLLTKAELESKITPMMAMVPMGPERGTRDMVLQHNWLEAAFHNPPKPCDSERRK